MIVATVRPISVAIIGMVALAVAMGIGRFAFTPLIPVMQAEGVLDLSGASWLACANYVGYLLGSLAATKWNFDARVTVRVSLAVIAAVTAAMAVTANVAVEAVLRTAAGVASALVMIHVSAWGLEEIAKSARPALGSLLYAGVGFGITTAGAVCAWAAAEGMSSVTIWVALGVLAAFATVAIWPRVGRSSTKLPHTRGSHVRTRQLPHFWQFVSCQGAFGFGYIIPATFLPAMAREAFPDPRIYGWIWPIFGLAAAASTALAPIARRAAGQRRAWGIANYVMAAGLIVPAVFPSLLGITIAALAVGGTLLVITLFSFDEARLVAGEQAPQLIASMLSAF